MCEVCQTFTRDRCLHHFVELNQHMKRSQPYEHAFLNQFTPDDPRRRYDYLQSLERSGWKFPIVIVTHSSGNNAGNIHFVWHVSSTEALEAKMDRSQAIIEEIKPSFPIYHTRAMRTEMFSKFGLVAPGVKPAVLRYFYRSLTGDSSSAKDSSEAEIDSCVLEVLVWNLKIL